MPDLVGRCAPGRFPETLVSRTMGELSAVPVAMRSGNHAAGGGQITVGDAAIDHAAPVTNLHEFGSLAGAILANLKVR